MGPQGYRRLRDGATADSLYRLVESGRWLLDAEGVRAAFGEIEDDRATCLAGIERWATTPAAPSRPPSSFEEALRAACATVPAGAALALSGGLDSAVLLAVLRDRVTVFTLAPELGDYDESARAAETARALGVPVRVVAADADAFVQAVPAAVRAAATPLYNLHPVGRWLLARAVARDGFTHLVTGDGADQLLAGVSGADHLPILGALTRDAGLSLAAPFLAPALASFRGGDPDKRALRSLAIELGLPRRLVSAPKRPALAPALDLETHWDAARIEAIARQLGRPVTRSSDRARVGWTTLGLFAKAIDACAA